jgi:phosphopantetheine adenylyltransferase
VKIYNLTSREDESDNFLNNKGKFIIKIFEARRKNLGNFLKLIFSIFKKLIFGLKNLFKIQNNYN